MLKTKDIAVSKNLHGAIVCSAVIGDRLISRQYYGFTKREAIRLFREEVEVI
jgi:hypothetical protein